MREPYTGRPYSLPLAVASSVGIKFKPQDVEVGFANWAREFAGEERALQDKARQLARDAERGMMSPPVYDNARKQLEQQFQELGQKRRERFEGAR